MTDPATPPRQPGVLAASLAAAAPLVALFTTTLTLFLPPWSEMPRPVAWWLLLALVAASALVASALLWRGIRRGAFSPLPLLGIAAAPWVAGLVLGWFEARAIAAELAGQGASIEMLLSATPSTRMLGLLCTWSLAGSVGFGLAVAAVAGRPGRPRLGDVLFGLASVLPLALFVIWEVAAHALAPGWLEAGLLGLALWAAPIVVGLASASPTGTRETPADRWRIGTGLAVALGFLAAASLYRTVAALELSRVFAVAPDTGMDVAAMVREDLAAAGANHLVYSAVTDYELGAIGLLPYRAHLALDAAGAVGIAAAPWVAGRDDGIDKLLLAGVGLYELGAVALSDPDGD